MRTFVRMLPIVLATLSFGASADVEQKYVPEAKRMDVPWAKLAKRAREFVDAESPEDVWPFEFNTVDSRPTSTSRLVIAHYFPPFPISIDGQPAANDHWNKHYLVRSGENGKFFANGGLVRQRPLPSPAIGDPFWRQIDTAIDVERAKRVGIDGFGVDITEIGGGRSWEQAIEVCDAAASSGAFFFIPELDVGILATKTVSDFSEVLSAFSRCPAVFKTPQGKMLVIPYAAENKSAQFWSDLVLDLKKKNIEIEIVPNLLQPIKFIPPFKDIASGFTWWGDRDYKTVVPRAREVVAALNREEIRFWLAPIASQDVRPKTFGFFESHNADAFFKQWDYAIENNAPAVHLITWNDYSEATEISPSSGTQFFFYDLTRYFSAKYKQGVAPKIKRDAIYYNYRTQVVVENSEEKTWPSVSFRNMGQSPITNDIEAIVFLTKPATLRVTIGGQSSERQLPAGVTPVFVAATPGRPTFSLVRSETELLKIQGAWRISESPGKMNPVYFGGSSTRQFVRMPVDADSDQ